ncbi:MAG: hypothetical protein ACEPOZ_11525 [Marinifilaceae bacterium]
MERKKKLNLYITSYYKSLLAIASSMILIFYCVIGLNKEVDDYPMVKGVILKAHLYWEKSPFTLSIDKNPNQWYDIYPKRYYSTLEGKAIPGKIAEIWYDPQNNNIKKLVVENEVLRPYVNNSWVDIVFIIVGGCILIFNCLYIIRNPSHAKYEKRNFNG